VCCPGEDHTRCPDCLVREVEASHANGTLRAGGLACCIPHCSKTIPKHSILDLFEGLQRHTIESKFQSAQATQESKITDAQAQALSEQINDAFNLCCPKEGCGAVLDEQIEACNAAQCSNPKCQTHFCWQCHDIFENSRETHNHVRTHSNDLYERRVGHITQEEQERLKEKAGNYVFRYHWLLARKHLAHAFRKTVNPEVRQKALQQQKALLQSAKMWPFPAGILDVKEWIEEVNASGLEEGALVELLQNEYIYRHNNKDKQGALLIAHEIWKRGKPVLASLDVKDAAGIPQPDPFPDPNPELTASLGGMRSIRGEEARRYYHAPEAFTKTPNPIIKLGNTLWGYTFSKLDRKRIIQNEFGYQEATKICEEQGAVLATNEDYLALRLALENADPERLAPFLDDAEPILMGIEAGIHQLVAYPPGLHPPGTVVTWEPLSQNFFVLKPRDPEFKEKARVNCVFRINQ
jgi:hypothetical protein